MIVPTGGSGHYIWKILKNISRALLLLKPIEVCCRLLIDNYNAKADFSIE
jgi:hypothetical protein